MDTQAATRPHPLQTFVVLLPNGKCAIVRYWKPIDAFLCDRCEKCTARRASGIDGSRRTENICIRLVERSSLYAECFG
jgi:hypothetical protein